MDVMASTVRGISVVCHKEGTGPHKRDAHYGQRLHQRRRRPLGRLHNRTGEDACPERSDRNADAHLKRAAQTGCTSQIMGGEVVVAVTHGRLDFGTWERIFYGEFDGRRRKRVLVKIIGE
jgi:thiamine phosphate synthase YjbQ (UPF0047 family)